MVNENNLYARLCYCEKRCQRLSDELGGLHLRLYTAWRDSSGMPPAFEEDVERAKNHIETAESSLDDAWRIIMELCGGGKE